MTTVAITAIAFLACCATAAWLQARGERHRQRRGGIIDQSVIRRIRPR